MDDTVSRLSLLIETPTSISRSAPDVAWVRLRLEAAVVPEETASTAATRRVWVVGSGVGVSVGRIGVFVGVGVKVSVEVAVGLGSGMSLGVGLGPGVSVSVGVGVLLGVSVSVGTEVGLGVLVSVGLGAGLVVAVSVGVGVGPRLMQLPLPTSVNVWPAIGTNPQSYLSRSIVSFSTPHV